MNNELIASYSDDNKYEVVFINKDGDIFYEGDDIPANAIKETREIPWEIMKSDWDCLTEKADTILSSKTYVRVVGFANLWNGSYSLDMIIPETTLDDIISTYMNIDRAECEVYSDRVEFKNIHHDGTNRYTFYPFSFNEFTIPELKDYFDEYNIIDFNAEKLDNPFHSAYKDDLVWFVEEYELYE